MIAIVVRQSGFREQAERCCKTRYAPTRELVPADIERGELREEPKLAVGKIVVDPPRHRLPGNAFLQVINQPGNDYAGHRPHAAVSAALIPDMSRSIALI